MMKSRILSQVFLKINFTEALYILCNFTFLQPHLYDQQCFRHR
jgi:hypothetical protein